jgi:hypothetical protein
MKPIVAAAGAADLQKDDGNDTSVVRRPAE